MTVLVACDGAGMDSSVVVNEEGVVPDLVCPGAIGCEDARGQLLVGAAARAITPIVESWEDVDESGAWDPGEPFQDANGNGRWDPVWIAGFEPGRAATFVHDDTWARALSISRGATRLGVVVLDLLGISHDDVVRLRLAAREAGLDVDHVLVIATHTHETQDPLGFGGPHLLASGYDRAYNDRVIAQAVDALREAIDREVEASLTIARTAAPGLIADSREPIVIDPSLHVLRFDGEDGAIATLVVWGNHAEALGGANTGVSSDYPHYLRRDLEAAYPGSVAFFVPGALGGLMNPMDVVGCPDEDGRETCATGTFEKAEFIGSGAARAALVALESGATQLTEPALELRVHSTIMRVTTPELLGAVQIGVLPRELFRTDGTHVELRDEPTWPLLPLDDVVAGTIGIQTEVGSVTLGPLTFVALPGEIYPELWLDAGDGESLAERPWAGDYALIAEDLPSFQSLVPEGSTPVVMNQANDAIGYIIPETQWDRLPPRAYVEEGQYGEGVSLGSHVARELFDAVTELYERE